MPAARAGGQHAKKAEGRRLAYYVHVTHPVTGERVVLPAGEVPPPELADVIGDHAYEPDLVAGDGGEPVEVIEPGPSPE